MEQHTKTNHIILSKTRKKCRLCLGKPTVAFPITEDLIRRVESITSIKLNIYEPRFDIICCKCNIELQLLHKIIDKFYTADIKLKELIEQGCLSDIEDEPETKVDVEFLILESEEIIDKQEVLSEKGEDSVIIEDNEIDLNQEDKVRLEYICNLCGKEFQDKRKLKNHMNYHQSKKCEFCDKRMIPSIYSLHLQSMHNSIDTQVKDEEKETPIASVVNDDVTQADLSYEDIKVIQMEEWLKHKTQKRECHICGKEVTKAKFKRHIYGHRRKECKICHITVLSSNYSKHMQIAHSSNSSPVICEICGAKAKNATSLSSHLYRYHSKSDPYTCEYCGKKFVQKSIMKSHIERLHLKVANTSICEKCGKSFYSEHQVKIHIRTQHANIKKYSCQYCNKTFTKLFSLKTHERQHTNETPYKCGICGEGFRQNISLRAHRKRKHNIVEELTVPCPSCTKKFTTEWALQTHINKMHPH